MLKDITIGQYFPGDTPIHKLDPRTKILDVVLFIVALFCCKGIVGYLLTLLFLVAAVRTSKIKLKTILKGIKPLVVIIVFTAFLNMFYTSGNVIFKVWKLTLTDAGIENAIFMIARILMLVTGTFLLTYTTSPITLTDGLERLLGPLKKIHVPVHELAMMMSIALRFIPTLIEETDKIMSAQKARGADFETGNIFQKAKALIPVLVPLFVSAFRRADELATAMECRCYTGGVGRTKLSPLQWQKRDSVGLLLGILLLAGVLVLRAFGL
jgi:energy-coupling factor transport system permease protein